MQPSLFKLESIFEEFEHVPGMIVLGASDAETYTVAELLQLTKSDLDLGSISLGYDDVKGRESLRQAIADSYSENHLSAANILITNGASEAIFLALHVLLKVGDNALVCHPCYQGLAEVAKSTGAGVKRYSYNEQTDFAPDLKVVRDLLKHSRPKVLLLNSPHNPTGQVLDRETLVDLLSRAKAVGTRVIVDEVFHGIWIDSETIPSAVSLDANAVIIGCLSKVYGLPGLRIGWLAGPAEFIEECKRLRYYTSLSPPSVVQQLAEAAVKNKKLLLQRAQNNVTRNYAEAIPWLEDHCQYFDWCVPQGGTVMLLKLKLPVDTLTFARGFATKRGVFLVPCSWAFEMEDGYLRLGLGGNQEVFKQGLTMLKDYLTSDGWAS